MTGTLGSSIQTELQNYRNQASFAIQHGYVMHACRCLRVMNSCLPESYRVNLKPFPIKTGITEYRWNQAMGNWYYKHLELVEAQNANFMMDKIASYQH